MPRVRLDTVVPETVLCISPAFVYREALIAGAKPDPAS
jgi:hypothetical protein